MSEQIWDAMTALTSLGAALTASYALWHTKDLDRRLNLRPYFRSKWRNIGEDMKFFTEAVNQWLYSLQQDVIPRDTDEFPAFPNVRLPDHTDFDWSFDVKAKPLFDQLARSRNSSIDSIRKYNSLKYLTSSSRRLIVRLEDIGAYDFQTETPEEGSKDGWIDYGKNVIFQCLGKENATFAELEQNDKYQALLVNAREEIDRQLSQLKSLLPTVRRKIDQFNASFAAGEA